MVRLKKYEKSNRTKNLSKMAAFCLNIINSDTGKYKAQDYREKQ